MPEKKLIADSLVEGDGSVCTLGAVGLKRGIKMNHLDATDPESVGRVFGISSMLAQEIVYENDEKGRKQTPEERWARMHGWATENLRKAPTHD